MPFRIVPSRPWLALGRHVYLPCAEPDGQCIKLNPHASQTWLRWMEAAGEAAGEARETRLAEQLAVLGVARVEGAPSP